MEYKNEKLGCSFRLPDKLTVRQILSFWQHYREVGEAESDAVHNWEAGKSLLIDWQCEALPDVNASLDEMTDMQQAKIVAWTGEQVIRLVLSLDELSPNS